MNAQEMINSGLLESYVLGIASPEEVMQVQAALDKYPELVKETEKIEKALLGLTESGPAPGAHVRNKILAQIKTSDISENPSMEVTRNRRRYTIAMAASIALLVLSVVFNFFYLNQARSLQSQIAEMESEKEKLGGKLDQQTNNLKKLESQMMVMSDPTFKNIVLKGVNDCTQQVTSLYWNKNTGEVYFNASTLVSEENRDYQLWAIVDGKPVDAGVIRFDNDSIFVKMKVISNASAFAVTIEKKGGVPVPTLSAMCYLGDV